MQMTELKILFPKLLTKRGILIHLLHLRSVNPGYCLHMFKATPEQGHHGRFLAGKAAIVAAISLACWHCRRRFLILKI